MALTLDELQQLLKAQSLQYFVHPERPAVMLSISGLGGSYRFVVTLEVEGTFLQFRSIEYLYCAAEHRHLGAVLRVLGEINYRARLVKFGWDPADGEIVAYADAWLQDGTLTSDQFGRMMHNYVSVIDISYPRITQTLETGKDPGEKDPFQALVEAGKAGGLPGKLAELVKKIRERGGEEGKEEEKKGEDQKREPDFSKI
jgi:hypothetical protein